MVPFGSRRTTLPFAGSGVAGGVGQLERIEETVIPELQADDGGEAGAGVGDAELADLGGFGCEAGSGVEEDQIFRERDDAVEVGGDGEPAELADIEVAAVAGRARWERRVRRRARCQ